MDGQEKAEASLEEEILYDCDICKRENVTGDEMYCCVNCEKNTCSDCCLASQDGDLFCCSKCTEEWQDYISSNLINE